MRTWLTMSMALLALLALGAAPFATPGDPAVIEDKDYCFRLALPGKGWRLLDEPQAQALNADALAGAMTASGTFGIVLAEPAFTTDLEEFEKAIFDAMSLPDGKIASSREIEFQKEKARRFQVDGTVDGTPLRWDLVIVIRSGMAYQIMCGGHRLVASWSMERLPAFHSAFSFIEGTPRVREDARVASDQTDVGWEVRDGTFNSAVFGITATPKPPWRLIVGRELDEMDAESHVGFTCADPQIYALLVVETTGAEAAAAAIAAPQTAFGAIELGTDPFRARLLGREVALLPGSSSDYPQFEYLCGLTSIDAILVKVYAWYPRSKSEVARPKLAEVLSTVVVLEEKARTESIARLSSAPDPQNRVGPSHSLRRGIYQDFASGFRWTKPPGFWRVLTGDDAKAQVEECTIQMEDLSAGITGYVTVFEGEGTKPDEHFQVLAEVIFGEEAAPLMKPRKIDLGDVEGLTASGNVPGEPATWIDLTVAIVEDRLIYMTLGGLASQMPHVRERVDAARAGLHVFAKVPAMIVESNELVSDARLGYSLRSPGEGWKRLHPPMGGSEAMGSSAGWAKGGQELAVVAICSELEKAGNDNLVDLMTRMIPGQFGPKQRDSAVRTKGEFLGSPCEVLSWKDKTMVLDMYFVVRDKTCYMVATQGKGAPFDRAVAERCFSFLP